MERIEGGGRERGQNKGRESMVGEREREIMILKQRTAFVFIWCDWLHALLLAAVRERAREREVKEMK